MTISGGFGGGIGNYDWQLFTAFLYEFLTRYLRKKNANDEACFQSSTTNCEENTSK